MTFDDVVRIRRSIRRYQQKPVEREDLMAILEAGRLAPSAKNAQTWHFTVVENETQRSRLVAACHDQHMVAEAPVTLVVWAESEHGMACGQSAATVDCSIAMTFMMLKATALGLGTCWLGAFDADAVKKVLGLPKGAVMVAITPIGYADETPPARPRKAMKDVAEIRE